MVAECHALPTCTAPSRFTSTLCLAMETGGRAQKDTSPIDASLRMHARGRLEEGEALTSRPWHPANPGAWAGALPHGAAVAPPLHMLTCAASQVGVHDHLRPPEKKAGPALQGWCSSATKQVCVTQCCSWFGGGRRLWAPVAVLSCKHSGSMRSFNHARSLWKVGPLLSRRKAVELN